MDSSWVKKTANAFWLAAARNMEQRRINTKQFQMLAIPGVVCASFSIELGIKAILIPIHPPQKTHNLSKLFSLLPLSIQDQIIKRCNKNRVSFEKSLDEIANVFEEWRYVYESESIKLDADFLFSLGDAVKEAADQHSP